MRASENKRAGTPTGLPWIGLLVLAGAIFLSVTSEVLPTGLLPDMSRGLGVSESRIGLLVTIFAGVVVITAAPMTALTRRYPRKTLVVVVLIAFALSNLLTAMAPNYEIVILSRVIGGLAHGLFWAVVGAYAAHLVPKEQLGRAIAITAAGASAAFVLGVPLGTALGHALGWRLAFAVTCGAMVLLAVLVAVYLPAVHHIVHVTTGEIPLPLRRDPSLLAIILVCSITGVVMAGHNIFFTYIVPYFIGVNGFPESSVSTLLFVYGGAGAIGLFLAGWVGIRFPRAGLVGAFLAVAASVLVIGLFPLQAWLVIGALVVFGIAFGGAPAMLQTRLLVVASPRLRDAASAYFTTAFNIAIGGGAFIGGHLLDTYGIEVLPFVYVAVALAGVVLILVSDVVLVRRSARIRRVAV
jgi:MFS transporter, DHA1 family, inner membrane transport protein